MSRLNLCRSIEHWLRHPQTDCLQYFLTCIPQIVRSKTSGCQQVNVSVDGGVILPYDHLKGEPNVDKKCQSDDLFYIIMNEIRPRVDQFLVILKKS